MIASSSRLNSQHYPESGMFAMRTFTLLLLLTLPLAARAEDATRAPDDIDKTMKQLRALAHPLILCDSVIAEDCFRMLSARIPQEPAATEEKPCLSAPAGTAECDRPKR
jgi:hypothetical protein